MAWLLPTRGSLDFQRLELCINSERIKCTGSSGDAFVGRVVVAAMTVIPPGHETIIPGTIVGKQARLTGPAIVEPN